MLFLKQQVFLTNLKLQLIMKLITSFNNETKGVNDDLGLLILRAVFGFTMMYGHGLGKLNKLTSGEEIQFMNFMGLGEEVSLALVVFAEFFCAILLIAGLFTRWAVIPLIFTMGVAFFKVHFNDAFGDMEASLIYLAAYLAVYLLGPGRYSLDFVIWNRMA